MDPYGFNDDTFHDDSIDAMGNNSQDDNVDPIDDPSPQESTTLPTLNKPFLYATSSNSTKGGSSAASISSSSVHNSKYNNNINNLSSPLSSSNSYAATSSSVLRSRSNSIISTTNHIHSSSNFTDKILPNFVVSQYMADVQVREEYSTRVLQALLAVYPKSVRIDSEGSRLPLHTAVAGRAILPVIRRILAAYPDAARHRNKEGYLPLHLAAHWGVSSSLVAPLLLMAYPDACLGKNRWEHTPLEEALAIAGENGRMHQVQLVRALRRHPGYWIRVLHKYHLNSSAAVVEENLDQVEKLLDDLFHENHGYESNNNAFGMDSSVDIHVPTLLHNPESAATLDITGRQDDISSSDDIKQYSVQSSSRDEQCTLESLIQRKSWTQFLSRIQKDPTDVSILRKTPVRAGYTARVSLLYLSCERNPPLQVIETLVALCPVATITRKDPGGQLPLHAACTWGAALDVISFLIGIHPLACSQMDDLGNLPLHCACFSGCSDEVMDALLQAFPRAVMTRNEHGSVPSDIVRRLSHVNKRSVMDLIEKFEVQILLKPRSMSQDLASTILIVPSKKRVSSNGRMNHDEMLSDTGIRDSQPMAYGEKDSEIIKEGDGIDDDGMLWV